jgi:hypothetical protein
MIKVVSGWSVPSYLPISVQSTKSKFIKSGKTKLVSKVNTKVHKECAEPSLQVYYEEDFERRLLEECHQELLHAITKLRKSSTLFCLLLKKMFHMRKTCNDYVHTSSL